jgi:hypothetical protein
MGLYQVSQFSQMLVLVVIPDIGLNRELPVAGSQMKKYGKSLFKIISGDLLEDISCSLSIKLIRTSGIGQSFNYATGQFYASLVINVGHARYIAPLHKDDPAA